MSTRYAASLTVASLAWLLSGAPVGAQGFPGIALPCGIPGHTPPCPPPPETAKPKTDETSSVSDVASPVRPAIDYVALAEQQRERAAAILLGDAIQLLNDADSRAIDCDAFGSTILASSAPCVSDARTKPPLSSSSPAGIPFEAIFKGIDCNALRSAYYTGTPPPLPAECISDVDKLTTYHTGPSGAPTLDMRFDTILDGVDSSATVPGPARPSPSAMDQLMDQLTPASTPPVIGFQTVKTPMYAVFATANGFDGSSSWGAAVGSDLSAAIAGALTECGRPYGAVCGEAARCLIDATSRGPWVAFAIDRKAFGALGWRCGAETAAIANTEAKAQCRSSACEVVFCQPVR